MQQDEIYTQLTAIFRDTFGDETLVLTPALTASEIPAWDSFNHISLIVAVESRFQIKFRVSELDFLRNVGHLADSIHARLASQGR